MDINEAACVLSVKEDQISEFETTDVFNNNNLLRGFLCRQTDHRYGALVISSINNTPCSQVVCGTPKMHYPFNKNGDFSWPKIHEAQIWEKIDGTNVLAYHYEYGGQDLVSYKTRLTPVIRDMKFGYFEAMWRELLSKEQWISDLILLNPALNLSFELYGERNPITIQYNIPLAAALLFGVKRDDFSVKPPTQITGYQSAILPKNFSFDSSKSMTEVYSAIREEMTERNGDTLVEEGVVLYAHVGEPSWRQFKCKPEQVEKIHWSNGGIPHNALWTTAINAYENNENPSMENFLELLREEYSESQIQRCVIRVQKIFQDAHAHMEMVASVNKAWAMAQSNGFDVRQDKSATMRFLSQYFDKKDMRRVGSIVLKQAGM